MMMAMRTREAVEEIMEALVSSRLMAAMVNSKALMSSETVVYLIIKSDHTFRTRITKINHTTWVPFYRKSKKMSGTSA